VERLKRQTEERKTASLEELPLAAEGQAKIVGIAQHVDLPIPYGIEKEVLADAEITANNLAYFGEPAYEYDIAQAIEDGYLAACEIQKGRVNLDDTGITKEQIIARSPVDAITGQPITAEQIEEIYQKTQYEDRILLPDRVLAMCQDLFKYLIDTGGPEQKSIIFRCQQRQ
jgi:type I restriction enzyme R subunit